MEHGSSLEANKEISCLLWNLKVNFHVHKGTPPGPVLSKVDPVHIITGFLWDPF
jgi:hypothetical protein